MNQEDLKDLEKRDQKKANEQKEAEDRVSKAVEDYTNPKKNPTWEGKKLT